MPALKNQPEPLTRKATKRDGAELDGKIIVAEGTPLARLQSIHDDSDTGVLVGDVNDAVASLDEKLAAVANLKALTAGKRKGERIVVDPKDIKAITAKHIANAN